MKSLLIIETIMVMTVPLLLLATTAAVGQLPPRLQDTFNIEELLDSLAQGVVLNAGAGEEVINATASNATTTTTTTNATSSPERLYIERLQAEDPSFHAFDEIFIECGDSAVFGNGSYSHIQCLTNMQEGIDKWCGIEGYDVLKCEYSQAAMGIYRGIVLASQYIPPS